MDLQIVWFVILAILWAGFFVLEGFDFGVGALHRVIGRTELQRRVAINAIGPVWDGNEVWLIVGGAGIFAAFPGWYATWFSAGYLALVLVLVALIIRGVSFEWRGKGPGPRWAGTFSWMLTVGSILAPLLLGVALGDLLAGLPVDAAQNYTGNFFDLLTPYGLTTGLTLLLLCLVQGATFLTLKTTDELRANSHTWAARLSLPTGILACLWAIWTVLLGHGNALSYLFGFLTVVGAVSAIALVRARQEGRGFAANSVAVAAAVLALFASLYPNVLVSSTDPAYNLTLANTASGQYALTVMTIVAVGVFPVVLIYQGWTYVVFRRRLRTPAEPEQVLSR